MYPNIRGLRTDNDLTQRQVARYLDMSQTGYSKYETGENDVPTSVLLRLADLYDVSVDYLLQSKEKPRRPQPDLLAAMKSGLYRE